MPAAGSSPRFGVRLELVLEIVDNTAAFAALATQIAAGEAPDIIGPVGVRGRTNSLENFLDLEPLIESSGFDLSAYDEAQVEFWREDDGALTGVPFGVFPSMIYYNAELFDEAGLDYPPAAMVSPMPTASRGTWTRWPSWRCC